MVSYDEFDLWRSIYFLSVQKYVRHHISCDHGIFAGIFGYVPSKNRDLVSERNNKVFCGDYSFRNSYSFDR